MKITFIMCCVTADLFSRIGNTNVNSCSGSVYIPLVYPTTRATILKNH